MPKGSPKVLFFASKTDPGLIIFAIFPEWASAQGSLLVGGPLGLTPAQVAAGVGGFISRVL